MVRHHGKFVSYLRVSTKRQGESGLGLEAQRAAVEAFLNGGSWQLVAEHVEVESGSAPPRVEVRKAAGAEAGKFTKIGEFPGSTAGEAHDDRAPARHAAGTVAADDAVAGRRAVVFPKSGMFTRCPHLDLTVSVMRASPRLFTS
jgi:hypothetical protein